MSRKEKKPRPPCAFCGVRPAQRRSYAIRRADLFRESGAIGVEVCKACEAGLDAETWAVVTGWACPDGARP